MRNSEELLLQIWDSLVNSKNVLIFPHDLPDGDAIGSSVAVARLMRCMGKRAHIFVHGRIPDNLKFLDYDDFFISDDEECMRLYPDLDTAIMLDGGDESRISTRTGFFSSANTRLCIDHHKTESKEIVDIKYCDSNAAATGQLIYRMLKLAGVEPDVLTGLAIFTAIMTDTGCFQYSNTTREIFEIAGELHDMGVDSQKAVVAIYQSNTLAKVKLHSEVLSQVELLCGGIVGFAYVSQEMIRKAEALMEDSEGVVEQIRNIDGVELSVLVKEMEEHLVKVSMRAKSYVDVSIFAEKYGGGGHIRAAGFSLELPLVDALPMLKLAIFEYMSERYGKAPCEQNVECDSATKDGKKC